MESEGSVTAAAIVHVVSVGLYFAEAAHAATIWANSGLSEAPPTCDGGEGRGEGG